MAEAVALLESGWRNAHALVVGDVMLDKYVWGDVSRISPEAPVPVVRAGFEESKPGGAANVAMNLAGLGARVSVAGFAGGDEEQRTIESLLREAGVKSSLHPVPAVPTTTKLRILSGGQQMMRLDREAAPHFSEADYRALLDNAFATLPDVSVVVLSDYAKGALSEAVCGDIIGAARERKIPVLVDPKNRSFFRYRGANAICPNLKELAVAIGEAPPDLDRLLTIAQSQLTPLRSPPPLHDPRYSSGPRRQQAVRSRRRVRRLLRLRLRSPSVQLR